MLKAKKVDNRQLVSCEASQIKSSAVDTKALAASREVEYLVGASVDGSLPFEQSDRNIIDSAAKGRMIDVQLSSDSHLTQIIGVKSSEGPLNIAESSLSNETQICPSLSPNAVSDNQESCFRPLIPSMPSLGSELIRKEAKSMSPIIKQEAITAASCRTAMYHQNGPAEIHSPSSSCNSHPSPEHRTSSPSSPIDRNDVLSPPESAMNQAIPCVSPNAGVLILGGSTNSQMPPYSTDPLRFVRPSTNSLSPPSNTSDVQLTGDHGAMSVTAAMAVSEMGLPTLVPSLSAIPSSSNQHFFRIDPETDRFELPVGRPETECRGVRVSPNAPTGPNPPRGIVGQKQAAAANESRGRRSGGSVDEKCPYKRPPHTYPALIASAILDSPGNLITLRGIYDYIMNNFPYYKFGHDKSAWQNSIRHNLSLNQCFVKVPRYENAAKSNYWTMTREGFEEFGNENSFKRRRRRGAALAPISAYKNKKPNSSEGSKGPSKLKGTMPVCNGARPIGPNTTRWSRRPGTPESGEDYKKESQTVSRTPKRVGSPRMGLTDAKHPRMMVLKQGEGPAIVGLGRQMDRPRRPNSLSSVEEMQGNVNSFSKTLSATGDHNLSDASFRKNKGNFHAEILTQQWMMAAMQKNINLFPPGILPSLAPSSAALPVSFDRNTAVAKIKPLPDHASTNIREAVIFDGTEIGYQVPSYVGGTGSKLRLSYCCRFCEFTHIDDSSAALEQHCQIVHPLEVTNAKAKAVAAAVLAGRKNENEDGIKSKSPCEEDDCSSSLPRMVSGVSSSMLAAAASYNNAQSFLAAAQAAGLAFPMSTSYPSSFTVPNVASMSMPHSSLSRVLSQNIGPGRIDLVEESGNGQNYLSDSAKLSQEQLRQLVYQQLITQNPFFLGNSSAAASMPRPPTSSQNDMAQLAHLWQYQQKVLEIAVQSVKDNTRKKSETIRKEPLINRPQIKSPNGGRRDSSSSNCSQQNEQYSDVDAEEKQEDIHGWKQCHDCDFTAKGAHGLELHHRKVHGSELTKEETITIKFENSHGIKEEKFVGEEDASGQSNEGFNEEKRMPHNYSVPLWNDSGTQTIDVDEKRTCEYCDVTFGDDTMYALHMTCHDRDNPFKCKICEKDCHEKYYFNVHLLRGLHQPRHSPVENERRRPKSIEHFSIVDDKEHLAGEQRSKCALISQSDHGP